MIFDMMKMINNDTLKDIDSILFRIVDKFEFFTCFSSYFFFNIHLA